MIGSQPFLASYGYEGRTIMEKQTRSLLLLRHAKSSWSNMRLKDFDRPLNTRGLAAAPVMARYLSDHFPLPDVILCSSAQRTRETLASVLHFYRHPAKVILTRDLYMASVQAVIGVVKRHADTENHVMVIGHNPGMEETAFALAGGGEERHFHVMREKYPTAACAQLSFDFSSWQQLAPDQGVLENFIRPRDVRAESTDGTS